MRGWRGKIYINYITMAEGLLVILVLILLHALPFYVFVSIEQLMRSYLGPMECMESGGKQDE